MFIYWYGNISLYTMELVLFLVWHCFCFVLSVHYVKKLYVAPPSVLFWCLSYLAASSGVILQCDWSPRILNANLMSRGITVTLLAWTANKLTSSNSSIKSFLQLPVVQPGLLIKTYLNRRGSRSIRTYSIFLGDLLN